MGDGIHTAGAPGASLGTGIASMVCTYAAPHRTWTPAPCTGPDARDPAAPTLVLLHGLTDSGECWPDAVGRWQDTYRIARPGRPRARCLTALHRRPAGRRPDRADVPRHRGPGLRRSSGGGADPVVLIGHSMGGGIAAAVAARHPDLVRAAVLEDPAWFDQVSWADRHESAVERVATCQEFRDDIETAMALGKAENAGWPEVGARPVGPSQGRQRPRLPRDRPGLPATRRGPRSPRRSACPPSWSPARTT